MDLTERTEERYRVQQSLRVLNVNVVTVVAKFNGIWIDAAQLRDIDQEVAAAAG